MRHAVDPVPEGVHTVVPYLCLKGAAAAIDFYKRAFGATEPGARITDSTGRVGHAEIRIGDSAVVVADEHPELGFSSPLSLGGCPVLLMLNVADVDAMVARAVDAGAGSRVRSRISSTALAPARSSIRSDTAGTCPPTWRTCPRPSCSAARPSGRRPGGGERVAGAPPRRHRGRRRLVRPARNRERAC
jgi:uncharacterized glyoxalase superfamily protein PhnB